MSLHKSIKAPVLGGLAQMTPLIGFAKSWNSAMRLASSWLVLYYI